MKTCSDCGKAIEQNDQFTETCYNCQDYTITVFSEIGQTLSQLILITDLNSKISKANKFLRKVALFDSAKLFGVEPDEKVEKAEEYIDDPTELANALNEMLIENEDSSPKSEKFAAWTSFSLIQAIKELGATPDINFSSSKFFDSFPWNNA